MPSLIAVHAVDVETSRDVLQIASYELGQLLPKEQQPLPLDLLRTGDSRSDVVPNGGAQDALWQHCRDDRLHDYGLFMCRGELTCIVMLSEGLDLMAGAARWA